MHLSNSKVELTAKHANTHGTLFILLSHHVMVWKRIASIKVRFSPLSSHVALVVLRITHKAFCRPLFLTFRRSKRKTKLKEQAFPAADQSLCGLNKHIQGFGEIDVVIWSLVKVNLYKNLKRRIKFMIRLANESHKLLILVLSTFHFTKFSVWSYIEA